MEENDTGNMALAVRDDRAILAALGIRGPLSCGFWHELREYLLDLGVPEDQLAQAFAMVMAMRAPALGSSMAVVLTAENREDAERLLAACASVQPEGAVTQIQGLTPGKAFSAGPQLSGKCLVGFSFALLGKAVPQVLKLFQSGVACSQVLVERGEGRLDTMRFEGALGLVVLAGSPEDAEKHLSRAVRIHLPASPKELSDRALLRSMEAPRNRGGMDLSRRLLAVQLEKIVDFPVSIPFLGSLLKTFPDDIPNRGEIFEFIKEILSLTARMNATPPLNRNDLTGKGLGLSVASIAKQEILSNAHPRLHEDSQLACGRRDYAAARAILEGIFQQTLDLDDRELLVFEELKNYNLWSIGRLSGLAGMSEFEALERIALNKDYRTTLGALFTKVKARYESSGVQSVSEATFRRVVKSLVKKELIHEERDAKTTKLVYWVLALSLERGIRLPKTSDILWTAEEESPETFWNPVTGIEEPL